MICLESLELLGSSCLLSPGFASSKNNICAQFFLGLGLPEALHEADWAVFSSCGDLAVLLWREEVAHGCHGLDVQNDWNHFKCFQIEQRPLTFHCHPYATGLLPAL